MARLAVVTSRAKAREGAIAALKKREPRDFVALLISMIPLPVEYKVQPVQGPGSQGALLIDTPRFRMLRTYDAPPAFTLAQSFRGTITIDPSDGMPVVYRGVDLDAMRLLNFQNQALKTLQVKERSRGALSGGEREGRRCSAAVDGRCELDRPVQHAGGGPERSRLADPADGGRSARVQDGSGRLVHVVVRSPRLQLPGPGKGSGRGECFPESASPSLTTCFAAGTPVRTIEGFRPIEEIRPGELVLSQDVATGGLEFRPIVLVHHNAPNQTLRITLSNDEILSASVYHRFWRSGKGWAQARELERGDVLRAPGGTLKAVAVEPGAVEPYLTLMYRRIAVSSSAIATCWCTTTLCLPPGERFR